MAPATASELPLVSPQRVCACGQRVRWSHLRYLGRGRSQPVYVCVACGLAYRGQEAEAAPPPSRRRDHRSLPDGGHPDNPVLDEAMAAKLRQLISGS